MAEVEKHTTEAMLMIMKHNERQLQNDSNTDIITERSQLNYSIPLDHGKLTDSQYFKKIVSESYLYGRGSSREAEAITSFSWVITLPKSICDYTTIDKSNIGYLNYKEERTFFEGAVHFFSERYGAENVIHNKIHYDEAGQPHIHIYGVPRKELDHDLVHYKTEKTKEAIQTESGRWEFKVRCKLDADGERIPVKNYARMSDYYDTKLSCKEIINSVELKHFHPDFAEYLRKNHLPGADSVYTGVTGGKNISVGALKEFTRSTGLTIDQVKEIQQEKNVLQEQVIQLQNQVKTLSAKSYDKDTLIDTLKEQLHDLEMSRERSLNQNKDISVSMEKAKSQIHEKDAQIKELQKEVNELKTKLQEVERLRQQEIEKKAAEMERMQQEKEAEKERAKEWGSSSGWGQSRGWGEVERGEQEWSSTWQK